MEFRGELYINGKDAWMEWNAKLIEGSLDNLLLPANPKPYIENNNRSEDGTRLYVINPRVQERNVQVTFGITCKTDSEFLQKYNSFIRELNSGWLILSVKSLNITYKLILNDYVSLNYGGSRSDAKLVLRFREVNPADRSPAIGSTIFDLTFDKTFN